MTFWPNGYDPRSEVVGYIALASIDAPSGLARFMIGQDGRFVDINGSAWVGSQLIQSSAVTLSRGAIAPEGEITLSYYQDPDAPDLIDQIKESGDSEIRGSMVRYYLQPLTDISEFYAPKFPPVLRATRRAAGMTFTAEGDTVRSISLRLESPFAARIASRGLFYTSSDHAALVDAPNPSLNHIPQIDQQLEKMYG